MKHNIRVAGKFATDKQKAKNDVSKYKDLAMYFQSIIAGHYKRIRQLSEENTKLKDELNELRARVAFRSVVNSHLNSEKAQ